MGWRFTESVEEFAARTFGVLAREPERQTVALSVIESTRQGVRWGPEPPLFGWWEGRGATGGFGAVIATHPYPLLLAAVPDGSVDELVDRLQKRAPDLVGVNGERAAAEEFASAWSRATGAAAELFMEQRLYRLEDRGALTTTAPGQARPAEVADADLIVRWYTAFSDETAPGQPHPDHASIVRHRVDAGLIWLWQDGGSTVALAGRNPVAAGVARVGPVYTPPQHRGRGYGGAVTAACTCDALEQGAAGVVLFTDVANGTTNAIYQTIGYRPVEDRLLLRFVSGPDRT